jgi:hypothetical protein
MMKKKEKRKNIPVPVGDTSQISFKGPIKRTGGEAYGITTVREGGSWIINCQILVRANVHDSAICGRRREISLSL